MKKFISIFSFLIFALFFISEVSCIGVLPGRRVIDYSVSQFEEGSFKIINSEERTIFLSINLKGDLEKSFEFSENNIFINPNEEKVIYYNITLSEDLSPGTHVQEIIISELKNSSQNVIDAIVGVITQVYVRVPYPGKYADLDFNIEGADSGQEVTFSLIVSNLGNEKISEVITNIDVFNVNNKKIGTISLDKISVGPGEKSEVTSFWVADVAPGEYFAEAVIQYGSEVVSLKKDFFVGSKVLNLNSVFVKQYSLGGIAKFEMDVENKWASDIKNVYSQTSVFDSSKKLVAEFRSSSYDISALNNQTLFSYWDTEGISEGIYDAVIYLRYGENFSKQNVQFDVGKTRLKTIGLGYVISQGESSDTKFTLQALFIVILVLVILNLLWFVLLRKKFKK